MCKHIDRVFGDSRKSECSLGKQTLCRMKSPGLAGKVARFALTLAAQDACVWSSLAVGWVVAEVWAKVEDWWCLAIVSSAS